MSNRVPVLACALALALVAAACGSSDPSATAAPDASTPATAPASSAPASTSAPSTSAPAASPAAGAPELACTAPATPTTPQTEGPYYTPGAPEKPDLVEAGMPGTPLVVTGFVVDTSCTPLAGATVDVWQADANGEYDNSGGYRLRGYVLTDADVAALLPGQHDQRGRQHLQPGPAAVPHRDRRRPHRDVHLRRRGLTGVRSGPVRAPRPVPRAATGIRRVVRVRGLSRGHVRVSSARTKRCSRCA